jgi:hypothetical protein
MVIAQAVLIMAWWVDRNGTNIGVTSVEAGSLGRPGYGEPNRSAG